MILGRAYDYINAFGLSPFKQKRSALKASMTDVLYTFTVLGMTLEFDHPWLLGVFMIG